MKTGEGELKPRSSAANSGSSKKAALSPLSLKPGTDQAEAECTLDRDWPEPEEPVLDCWTQVKEHTSRSGRLAGLQCEDIWLRPEEPSIGK